MLGPLHILQIGIEGSQRIPIMCAKSWSHRPRTLCFVLKNCCAGLFCGVNEPPYGQGGGKAHFTKYTCARRNKKHVHTLELNGHPIMRAKPPALCGVSLV